ncbi:MAG TPA: energy transducer TonB [Acidobacteriaceae bacterium]
MAVPWTSPEVANRFASYVRELQEFFASYGMHYGSPEDIHPVIGLLDDAGPFADDLSSMVRSIILREGGSLPRADLLEIVAVAICGNDVDTVAQELQHSIRHLMGFLNTVLRRPWNEPPGQRNPDFALDSDPGPAPVIEFPGPRAVPGFIRPESVYSRFGTRFDKKLEDKYEDKHETRYDHRFEKSSESEPADEFEIEPEQPAHEPHPVLGPTLLVRLEREPEPEPEQDLPPNPIPFPLPSSPIDPAPPPPPFSPSMLSALTAGAAALLVAVLLFATLHSHPGGQANSQTPITPAARPALDVATTAAAKLPLSKPSADVPTIGGPDISTPTHPVRIRHEDDDIIAEPYHTPIPGQPEVPIRPAANNIAPAAQPSTPGTPPTSAAAPILRQTARSIDPDSTYVGASAEDQAAAAESDRNSPGLLRRPNQHSNFRSSPTHEAYPTVSSGLMAGNLISAPLPSYPALAKFTHLDGKVILQAVISSDGTVSATHVLSGHRLLRGAAVDAVRHWRYRPYVVDGRPVDVATIVTVDFRNRD